MVSRLLAFLVWALLAFSAAYWLLKLTVRPVPLPVQAQAADAGAAPRADLGRLLGAAPPQALAAMPEAPGRYRLLGLVAPRQGSPAHEGEGVAVIAVDNAPARSVRVGGVVDGELRLLALDRRSASLGSQGVVSMRLELAPPAPAATGSLPPAGTLAPGSMGGGALPPPTPAALQGLAPQLPPAAPPPAPGGLPLRDAPTQ